MSSHKCDEPTANKEESGNEEERANKLNKLSLRELTEQKLKCN